MYHKWTMKREGPFRASEYEVSILLSIWLASSGFRYGLKNRIGESPDLQKLARKVLI